MNIHEWNNKVLKSKGIKGNAAYPKAVVRTIGDAKIATLIDGTRVERVDSIYVEGYGLVPCARYELHFVYELPKHMKGWSYMCTCGSLGGIVGYAAYSKLVSPTENGLLLVCVRHTTVKQNVGIGEHADGSHE